MDFYNKNFHQLTRHLDPRGMLNVPVNVFTDIKCLDRYFRTNKDFQKLDVPWMCDQLVTLLANFDYVAIFSTPPPQQNDFQYKKYTFFFISQAFIGLILIFKQSIKAYYSYCRTSSAFLYKNKIAKTGVFKKKKKKNSDDLPYRNLLTKNQQTDKFNQNQVILTDNVINELDVILAPNNVPSLLNQIGVPDLNDKENLDKMHRSNLEQPNFPLQPVGEFSVIDPNMHIDYPHISNELEKFMAINVIQPKHMESQESVEQSQNTNKLQNQNIENHKLTEQSKTEINQQEKNKQTLAIENGSPQNNLNNQLGKRKRSSKFMKGNYKKRPIEQSSKLLKNGLKTLEGQLFKRPLESIAMKYIHQSMNHLPLRYATYRSKLNIPFAVLTLNMELEENENQDDVFNNELTMNSYKAICEKLSNTTTNSCIYQQCFNNELPHLSLVPLAEECLTNQSLVWRNTINEINKKLEDSLKDIQNSKTDQIKWNEFKEKMKHRASQSLVAHKTLIGHELSHINDQHHLVVFPSPCQIDVPEPQSFIIESELLPTGNSPCTNRQPDIKTDNGVFDQFDLDDSQNIQNFVQPVENRYRQSVDVIRDISHVLQQSSENTKFLNFTDLCPVRLTKRKYASIVFRKLLGLHQKRIVKLSQTLSITEPSSISIQLNI